MPTLTAAPSTTATPPKRYAIIGAGVAGITCAKTLRQAGHEVIVFEQAAHIGGRTMSSDSIYGSFDIGAQYFTVRDPRFARAIDDTPGICKPWSACNIHLLDADGTLAPNDIPIQKQTHWVATPHMSSLVQAWAQPLLDAGLIHTQTHVTRLTFTPGAPSTRPWHLHTHTLDQTPGIHADFDGVVLAMPAPVANNLLARSTIESPWASLLAPVEMTPCWSLTVAYPQAVRPDLISLGPQWNAAYSTHHRLAWMARESSKPTRSRIERWTVHATPQWSQKHSTDEPQRVQSKLLKAFAQVSGIHAQPAHIQVHLWHHAQTVTPLHRTHLWDAQLQLGACGDWCIGNRIEDAFLSGLDMALHAT